MKARPHGLSFTQQRLVCENARFQVFLNELVEDGHLRVRDYLVVQPRESNEQMVTGVAVLPVFNGKLGLIRVHRPAIRAAVWEIPRGFVDANEPEPVAALRELEEETGLTTLPEDLHSLGLIAPDGGVLAAKIHLFVAAACRAVRSFSPQELGHEAFHLFSLEEVAAMVRDSIIQDPSTIIAYHKYVSSVYSEARS